MNIKSKLKGLIPLTILVLAIQVALSKFVYPNLGYATQNLFNISPTTALQSTVIGDKILGYLAGIIPFDLGNLAVWVSMTIGVFLLLFAGYWVIEQKWAPYKGKHEYNRLLAVLAYGTIILYALLLLTKMAVISTAWGPLAIGLAINYAIVGLGVYLVSKYLIKSIRI